MKTKKIIKVNVLFSILLLVVSGCQQSDPIVFQVQKDYSINVTMDWPSSPIGGPFFQKTIEATSEIDLTNIINNETKIDELDITGVTLQLTGDYQIHNFINGNIIYNHDINGDLTVYLVDDNGVVGEKVYDGRINMKNSIDSSGREVSTLNLLKAIPAIQAVGNDRKVGLKIKITEDIYFRDSQNNFTMQMNVKVKAKTSL